MKVKQIKIRDEKLAEALTKHCKDNGLKEYFLVEKLIREYLEKENENN